MCAPACWASYCPHRGKFIDQDRKRRSVVPVRFVRACRAGHIGDLDWYTYVHEGPTPCRRPLWIDERGTSGDLAEVSVRCECGQQRSMTQAAIVSSRALGHCDGARPWLGPYTKEPCGEPSRLLIRTASNAYFPQVMSVISLPDRDDTVKAAVDAVWEFLEIAEISMTSAVSGAGHACKRPLRDCRMTRSSPRCRPATALLSSRQNRSSMQNWTPSPPVARPSGKIRQTVCSLRGRWRRDTGIGPGCSRLSVVLVHRLREVVALVGFTRFEALAPDIEGEFEMGVRRVPGA